MDRRAAGRRERVLTGRRAPGRAPGRCGFVWQVEEGRGSGKLLVGVPMGMKFVGCGTSCKNKVIIVAD